VPDGDGIADDHVRVADLQDVHDLLVEPVVMVEHALLVEQASDVELQGIGDLAADVELQLGHPDLEIRVMDEPRAVQRGVVSRPGQGHLHGAVFVEVHHGHLVLEAHFIVPCFLEDKPGGDGEPTGFSHSQVRDGVTAEMVHRGAHQGRVRECMHRVTLVGKDHVGLDQHPAPWGTSQEFEPF